MLRFPYCKFIGDGISQNLNDSRWSGKKGGEKRLLKSQRGNFEGISYFTISYSQKVVSEKKRIQSAEGAKSGVWEAFCPFRTAREAVFSGWNQRKRGENGHFLTYFLRFFVQSKWRERIAERFHGQKRRHPTAPWAQKRAARCFSGSIGKEEKRTERRVWIDSESKEKNDASEK